jgi:pyruvate/2-oxoglutarate/acetoin dehydrogenase E1 component
MRSMTYSAAIDDVLGRCMARDRRIIILGEDVRLLRRNLFVRFGERRVLNAPISEGAFVGAAVAAAMAGLRPVVEVMMVDFIAVAMDALLNQAAKLETLSGGHWQAPLVIRVPCGGGYGDGGTHSQALWGWLAHIPGLVVVIPSTPADAGGLMLSALQHDGPVVFLEHKLLSVEWLDMLGAGGRKNLDFDVPPEGAQGEIPRHWKPIPFGNAVRRREGHDLLIASVGVGVHRALQAAEMLQERGISACVLDLRSVAPLDKDALREAAQQTGRLLVVDEDYQTCGLSGELGAVVLEAGISTRYARVCTETTVPFARAAEFRVLPNTARILDAALRLMNE